MEAMECPDCCELEDRAESNEASVEKERGGELVGVKVDDEGT